MLGVGNEDGEPSGEGFKEELVISLGSSRRDAVLEPRALEGNTLQPFPPFPCVAFPLASVLQGLLEKLGTKGLSVSTRLCPSVQMSVWS